MPSHEQRATRLARGTILSGVGHVALAVIGALAAVDTGSGAAVPAFWLWVVTGGVGLACALVLRADAAPAATGTPPHIGWATSLTVAEFFVAAASAFLGTNLLFLVVPLLLIGTNLMAMSAIRALARSGAARAASAPPA